MQAIDFKIPSYAQTVVGSVATTAALTVLGMVLAYWTWVFLPPNSESRSKNVMTATDVGNGVEAASRLFGNVPQGSNGSGAGASGVTFKLLGVVAAPGTQSGYAVMQLDAKRTVAVREGGEIESGVRLLEVHAGHVVLERNGQRETLAWVRQGQDQGQGRGKVLGPDVRGARN